MKRRLSRYRLLLIQREEISIAITLVVVLLVFGVMEPSFLDSVNLVRLLRQACITAIMAIGIVFVISANGMDVSVGAILAVCATLSAQLLLSGLPAPTAILVSLAAGAFMGLLNGLIVTKLGIKELIATLATSYIIRGLLLRISGAKWLTNLPRSFTVIGQGSFLGIPIPVYILLAVTAGAYLLSNYTALGKQIKAVGGNREAAILSGVNVDRIKILTFVICGFCTGVAGVVYAARMGSVQSNTGIGMEFEVISATLIGGASFNGDGSPVGALLGALLLSAIKNGLVIMGISPFMEGVVTGLLILVALAVNVARSRMENAMEVQDG